MIPSKYTTCDAILLFQIYYYRWKRRRVATLTRSEYQDTDPLLPDNDTDEENIPLRCLILRYLTALAFVVAVGLLAWWITQDKEDKNLLHSPISREQWWTIQVLGWSSALLFVRMHGLFLAITLLN